MIATSPSLLGRESPAQNGESGRSLLITRVRAEPLVFGREIRRWDWMALWLRYVINSARRFTINNRLLGYSLEWTKRGQTARSCGRGSYGYQDLAAGPVS